MAKTINSEKEQLIYWIS